MNLATEHNYVKVAT